MRDAVQARNLKKILFICTGNVCRSVMAQRLLAKLSEEKRLGLEIKSCGVGAERYFEVPEPVWRELARLGASQTPHIPQLVTRDLLRWTDIAFTMTANQWEIVLEQFPEFSSKVHVFRSWAGFADADVVDPMRKADAVYRESCDKIWETLTEFVSRLASEKT